MSDKKVPFDQVPRFKRLPQWAQTEMRILHGKLERAEHRAAEVFEATRSDVRLVEGMDELNLPANRPIRFYLGEDSIDYVEVHIDRNGGPEGGVPVLRVNGGDFIFVYPRAANLVEVALPRAKRGKR